MNTIKLNHWYINDNELAISLMHFYVSIAIINEDNNLYCNARVTNLDTEIKEMNFKLDNLEDAITFTEAIVSQCWTFDDVIKGYKGFCGETEKSLKKER